MECLLNRGKIPSQSATRARDVLAHAAPDARRYAHEGGRRVILSARARS